MTLFAELKRRNVFRVGAAYVVVSWLLLQIVDVVAPILELTDSAPKLILLMITIGFIPALLFAWAFELTPEGVKRERDVDRSASVTRQTGHKLNRIIIGVLVLVILMMTAERFWISGAVEPDTENQVAAHAEPANLSPPENGYLPPVDKSIAVLPFINRSAGQENTRFFSDGIHDDLLTMLTTINELKVISRTSVIAYRNTTKNMRQIGEELGVTNLLEGGVQQAGDRVRINVQLINAQTDEDLWAETYDAEVTTENIFEIQGEIARAITIALEATLTSEENKTLGRVPTQDLEAYRALLMSRQFAQRGNFESLEKAAGYVQKAIDLDPGFVDAHLALAQILARAISSGSLNDEEAGGRITAAIDTAMKLQPGYGSAFAVLGYYQYISSKPGWGDSFERAMQLDPGNAETMYAYGYSLQRSGNPEPALPLLLRASEQDPLSLTILFAIGRNYIVLEEYDKARNAFARIREIDPSSTLGYGPMGGSYFLQGQMDKALHWLSRAVLIDPQDFELGGWMVYLNDCLEDYGAAQEWSDWLDDWITKQPMPMAMQARHHYLTGNFELALQLSNRALKLDLPDRWGSDGVFMRIKRDEALANGNPKSGIKVFRERHPTLFEAVPEISANNAVQAVDLAQLLKMAGKPEETMKLLDAVIEYYEQPWSTNGTTRFLLVPVKAEALAIMDNEAAALIELRRIIDKGWRLDWRWETELNFNFNGIRETAEFKAMVNELASDMEEQRARVHAMIDRGEITPPPELTAR